MSLWSWKYMNLRNKSKILLLLVIIIVVSFYIISKSRRATAKHPLVKHYAIVNETVIEKYLVWNSKCHMLAGDPMDPTLSEFVKKYEFEACSKIPLLTSVVQQSDGTFVLVIDPNVSNFYEDFVCCWTPIVRPEPTRPLTTHDWDTKIDIGTDCQDFTGHVLLPQDLEIVMVVCKQSDTLMEEDPTILYKNIHTIINPAKVQDRLRVSKSVTNDPQSRHRKMSILVFGMDGVSRLNFLRSLPNTEKYLRESGWINLKGYNKGGRNTFPNLMAILTGQNESSADSVCKPTEAFGLDECPFLWHDFKKAGYVTAYAEDTIIITTFNYYKVGFVNPPTDYYFTPYVTATEKLLSGKERFGFLNYCTGPELSFDRIFDAAANFAKTFQGSPYFGFFWTNSVTHDDVNGITAMDNHLLNKFKKLEKQGIFDDAMVVFLSDHGMRFGDIRQTFIGWYEDRLPFIYLRVPAWFDEEYQVSQRLKANEYRLTSPYDLYETFRDVLTRAGGEAMPSSGCPTCQSLFSPVPVERGCEDAGISDQWCMCKVTKFLDPTSNVAQKRANKFLEYVESNVKEFMNEDGQRLCAKLELERIHHVKQIIDLSNNNATATNFKYVYQIEVKPGGGIFEVMMYVNQHHVLTMPEEEINRLNSYAEDGKCLENSYKKYCSCSKKSKGWRW